MPIAAVDEDHAPSGDKHKIGPAGHASTVQPVAKAETVREPTNEHLRLGIFAPYSRHITGSLLRSVNVGHQRAMLRTLLMNCWIVRIVMGCLFGYSF